KKEKEIVIFPNREESKRARKIISQTGVAFEPIAPPESFLDVASEVFVFSQEDRPRIELAISNKNLAVSGFIDYKPASILPQKLRRDNIRASLLKDINITFVAPCIADPKKIRLIAHFFNNVAEAFPYLNTVMKNATYNKEFPTLNFSKERRMVNIYSHKVAIAKADEIVDAWQILAYIKDLINDTYNKKDSIVPNFERKVRATALEIYSWLPKTNCKQCSETTCLAFAVKLLLGEQNIANCKPLFTERYKAKKKIMLDMVEALGYEVPEDLNNEV
ncbi:MAG: (Fe-S)-binding protein, partial [bacterium]